MKKQLTEEEKEEIFGKLYERMGRRFEGLLNIKFAVAALVVAGVLAIAVRAMLRW